MNDEKEESLFIYGALLPDEISERYIKALDNGEALISCGKVIAFRGYYEDFKKENYKTKDCDFKVNIIKYVYDIFLSNYEEIKKDFKKITKGRISQELPSCTRLVGPATDSEGHSMIFIEEGAEIECTTINTKRGPVYIGKNAIIMEGACLRGPLAVCNNTKIRMGSKIYGGTTFGPYCKVGGEIDNTIIFGFSNKAHDGYLGNAVVGEWCNIGAGVNASNLKNDYSKIRIWNYHSRSFMRTDLQFCGLIMGDHSKIAINCMLNTATVIGVGVNLHGAGFPRTFIPSFSEGSPGAGFQKVGLKKFHDTASTVMSRRKISLDEVDKRIYQYLHDKENSKK